MKTLSTLLALSTLACGLLVSCTSTDDGEGTQASMESNVPDPSVPKAWTSAFREPVLLFADRVYIEGPWGLLDHFAARTVDEYHSYDAETLPEGFRQVYSVVQPEAGVEMRAYLDALEIVVIDELVVIEKPGRLDVLVRASGNVYLRNSATGAEHRASELSLDGPIEPLPGTPGWEGPSEPEAPLPTDR